MNDDSSSTKPPLVTGNAEAPFIVADGVAAWAAVDSVIHLDLAAHTTLPNPNGAGAVRETVVTAHLRCSVQAALRIKAGIEAAIGMDQVQQREETTPWDGFQKAAPN